MSVLDKVRQWIDGESAELVLEEAARDAQVKPRSKSEEFIVKIARAVEEVMQNEMVPLPQGTTIIPTEYIIFLSNEDDKEWQGIKRRGLEQGLYHILAERAKEISGKQKLETKTFVVELRVDGTLEKGSVRVQHSWEDSSGGKTGVLPRLPLAAQNQPNQLGQNPAHAAQSNLDVTSKLPGGFTSEIQTPASQMQNQPFIPNQVLPPTVPQLNVSQPIAPVAEDNEEMTHVHKRKTELYRLEVWRGGVRQSVLPIYQNEISLGRGSKSKPVDVSLPGDPEISRRHITITTDGEGNFWMLNEGKNPAVINNYEIPIGKRVQVSSGMPIAICSYLLKIQSK
ncbi:MAG: hypothetical protein JWN60_614 [Acidobacteria bacterium]|nr:hypothetical protein [Acidobacteriota bacterium]